MSAASRWARLLAGVRAGSATLRHAVGSSLRPASSALHPSRIRLAFSGTPLASAQPRPASFQRLREAASASLRPASFERLREAASASLRPASFERLREAASASLRPASSSNLLARLRGATAETVRLLRAELDKVRRGPGLLRVRGTLRSRLRPASSETLARLRVASAELLRLLRDEVAALGVDAVQEETRLPEETSHIVGPRLRALGKAVADVVVDRNRLTEMFNQTKFLRRKRREQRRPPPRRPLPVLLVSEPAPPAGWRSCLRRAGPLPAPASILRRAPVAEPSLAPPRSTFLRPWHMPAAVLGARPS